MLLKLLGVFCDIYIAMTMGDWVYEAMCEKWEYMAMFGRRVTKVEKILIG